MIADVKKLAQSVGVFSLGIILEGRSRHLIACQTLVRDSYGHNVETHNCDLDTAQGVAFIPIVAQTAKTIHIMAYGIDPIPDGSVYQLKIILLKYGLVADGTPKLLKGKDNTKTFTTIVS